MKFFDYRNFTLQKLRSIKQMDGRRIGVALPVLNERKTLRKVIQSVQSCGDLVDHLIVMDGGSTDGSVEICHQMGVDVIRDVDAAKRLGIKLKRGKGWNLWTSLLYLHTDIVGWIDSDIEDVDERFVLGIIGPLLVDPRLQFVKGYYQRPKGDARVTELAARPMMNFFFPELTDFIQPLSGEYAATRSFLEKARFYSGYSVEIALLIQAAQRLRGSEIGQSYLGLRTHELQDVASLGKMSAGILRTMLEMGAEQKRLVFQKPLSNRVKRFTTQDGEHFQRETFRVVDSSLTPMSEQRTYQRSRKA